MRYRRAYLYFSPHLCVGFLFLVVHFRLPPLACPPASPPAITRLTHTQLVHPQLVTTPLAHTQLVITRLTHTQLVHTQLVTTPLAHTQLVITRLTHTQLVHTQLVTTPLAHTQLVITRLTHTQLVHTQLVTTPLAHTQLVITRLPHTPLVITHTHTTWSPHNLLTHNLITRQLIHTELVHTQLAWHATWRHGSSLSVAGLALMALGWLWWSIHPELSTPWDHWNHVSLRHPKVSTKILTIIGVILYNTLPYYPTSQGRGLKTPNRTFCTLMVLRFQAGINWMDGSNPWAHFSNHAWNSYLHLFAFSYIVNLSSYSSSMDGWSCGWILSGAPSKIVQVFETKGVLLIWRQFFPLGFGLDFTWAAVCNLGHLTSNFPWRLDSFGSLAFHFHGCGKILDAWPSVLSSDCARFGASDLSFSMLSWCFSFGVIVLGLFHFRVFFSAEFFFFAGNVSLLWAWVCWSTGRPVGSSSLTSRRRARFLSPASLGPRLVGTGAAWPNLVKPTVIKTQKRCLGDILWIDLPAETRRHGKSSDAGKPRTPTEKKPPKQQKNNRDRDESQRDGARTLGKIQENLEGA